jgi:hypothetical protein
MYIETNKQYVLYFPNLCIELYGLMFIPEVLIK